MEAVEALDFFRLTRGLELGLLFLFFIPFGELPCQRCKKRHGRRKRRALVVPESDPSIDGSFVFLKGLPRLAALCQDFG